MPKGIIYFTNDITIGRDAIDFLSLFRVACRRGKRPWLGEYETVKKYFALAGVLYAGVGSFITLVVYLRGNDSAYTTGQNWYDAFELGLTWPWQVLKYVGIGA